MRRYDCRCAGLRRVVGTEQHGFLFITGDIQQDFPDFNLSGWINAGGGFIKDKHLRVMHYGASQRKPLPHTFGIGATLSRARSASPTSLRTCQYSYQNLKRRKCRHSISGFPTRSWYHKDHPDQGQSILVRYRQSDIFARTLRCPESICSRREYPDGGCLASTVGPR